MSKIYRQRLKNRKYRGIDMRVLAIILAMVVLTGTAIYYKYDNCCRQECSQPTLNQDELCMVEWVPTMLVGAENMEYPKPAGEKEYVFIRFDTDGKVNGMSGDNLFGGTYKVDNTGKITFDQMYSTRRAGQYGMYESVFLTALANTNRITVDDDILCLYNGDKILLKFEKKTQSKK